MAWLIFAYFGILLSCQGLTEAQKYTDCGSVKGQVESVAMIPPCGNVCTLPSGSNVTLKIGFKSLGVSNKLKAVVHGIIGGIPFPFPLPNPDACTASGIKCPTENGASYLYSNSLEIKKEYPKIFVKIKYELKDEAGKDVICILFPAKIT